MGAFLDRHPAMWNTIRVVVVFVAVYLLASQFHWFGVGVFTFQIDGDTETLRMYYESELYVEIQKDDIRSLELTDDFDRGEVVELKGDNTYIAGIFENDTLGTYKLYVRDNVDTVIIIKAKDGYYVINYNDADSTEGVYEALKNW